MATSVLPDLPTTKDHLDFEASAATLASVIGGKATATPITVGVFGTWGTGKTSLMRMIEAALIKQSRRTRELKAHTVWFDAWKYDKEQELWRALLMRVLEAVRAVAEGRPTSEHEEWPVGEKSPY
jgi:predicted KAP-like P-loop ATPase